MYKNLLEQALKDHTHNSHIDPQGLLYLTGRHLEHLRVRNFTEQTVYNRAKMLRRFRLFCEELKITQAREVTRGVILNYQSYLYHYKKADGKPLTVATQKQWLGAVCTLFSWLTREGHVLYNPASDLEMPRKEYRLPKVILTHSEIEAIMNVPDITDPMGIRDRAILEVLYSTGVRRAELCGLNKADIEFDRGLVRVEQGKGHKDRFVPIGERALKWLEKYLVEVRPQLTGSAGEVALFLNTLGERISPTRLGHFVHRAIGKAGIGKKGSCHLFRHAFATALLENGCDIRHIQAMLGHAKLETTEIYTHVSVKELKQAHQKCHPAKLPK